MHHLAVQGERFDLPMRVHEDGAAGRLVHAARLHAHEAVLDQVYAADPVFAPELVERPEHAGGGQLPAVHRHAVAMGEVEFDVLRFVRGVLGGDREFKHALVCLGGWVEPGILENTGLVGDMEEVPVHRVRLPERGFDGNPVFPAVRDHLRAAGEFLPEGVELPRRDDGELGRQRHVGKLEAALIVALAGGAMGDRVRLLLLRNGELRLGDQGTRDRGSEVILAFIDGIRAHHRIDEVAREFLNQVEGMVPRGARAAGLGGETLQFLLLADVRGKGDDLRVVGLLQPFENDRGIEPARVCEDDFHGGASFGQRVGRAKQKHSAGQPVLRSGLGAGGWRSGPVRCFVTRFAHEQVSSFIDCR